MVPDLCESPRWAMVHDRATESCTDKAAEMRARVKRRRLLLPAGVVRLPAASSGPRLLRLPTPARLHAGA